MWKKDEGPDQSGGRPPETTRRPERPASGTSSTGRATIGRSITIRGDVTGEEDLLIQGRVEGSVDLKQHAITVGAEGQVKASVIGRVVTVEGTVKGDLIADEQVILRGSAEVEGDITAPRVVLEDGARFRGGVDMGDAAKPEVRSTYQSSTMGKSASESRTSSSDSSKATPEPIATSSEKGKGGEGIAT